MIIHKRTRSLTDRCRPACKLVRRHTECLLPLHRGEQPRRRRRPPRPASRQLRRLKHMHGSIHTPEPTSLILPPRRKNGWQPTHPPIMRRIPLLLGGSLLGQEAECMLVHDTGCILRPTGVHRLEGGLHLLGVAVHLLLCSRHEVAVHIVPAFGVLGELDLVPARDVPLDEVYPEVGVVFFDVRGFEFKGAL